MQERATLTHDNPRSNRVIMTETLSSQSNNQPAAADAD